MDWQRHWPGYHGQVFFALLADLVWYAFVGFRLGCGFWVGENMIASGLLNFRRCCALILEGKSQVGIILICVSSKGYKGSLWSVDVTERSSAAEKLGMPVITPCTPLSQAVDVIHVIELKLGGGRGGILVWHPNMVAHLLFCPHPASCTHQHNTSLGVWTQDVETSDSDSNDPATFLLESNRRLVGVKGKMPWCGNRREVNECSV
jgi:hypothetical protein